MWPPNIPSVRDLIQWVKYRNVNHFEIRWRPPNSRGWRQVDDPTTDFDPSNLTKPLSQDLFETHARHTNYYQGEYRLVPITNKGTMGDSVWQTWFYDGPSHEAEQKEQERQREQEETIRQKLLEEMKELRRVHQEA